MACLLSGDTMRPRKLYFDQAKNTKIKNLFYIPGSIVIPDGPLSNSKHGVTPALETNYHGGGREADDYLRLCIVYNNNNNANICQTLFSLQRDRKGRRRSTISCIDRMENMDTNRGVYTRFHPSHHNHCYDVVTTNIVQRTATKHTRRPLAERMVTVCACAWESSYVSYIYS